MKLLGEEDIFLIHELVIDSNELQGLCYGKSPKSVIFRIENRIHFGMIKDIFDLAASYAAFIAVGHIFNDANKRTAYRSMMACFELNDICIDFDTEEMGNIIINMAQGIINEVELAQYLRSLI